MTGGRGEAQPGGESWFLIGVLACTLIALATRLIDLGAHPAGLFFDEAMNGLDAIETGDGNWLRVWIPDNFDRGLVAEAFFSHLQALSIAALGPTAFAVRLPAALAGAACIPVVALLGRELTRSRAVGLIAAALMATAFWPVALSREAYPAVLVPLCLSLSLYWLFVGLRTGRWWPFIAGGAVYGLGFHTYAAYRLSPLILILIAPVIAVSMGIPWSQLWRRGLTFLGAAFAIALPMLIAVLVEPALLTARAGGMSVLNAEGGTAGILEAIGRNARLAIVKYVGPGDENWRYNIAGQPTLDRVIGICLVIGVVIAFVEVIRRSVRAYRVRVGDPLIAAYATLLIGFAVMLLPEILANEANPHTLRSIGTQPFVFILASLPLVALLHASARRGNAIRLAVSAVVAFIVIGSMAWNARQYFVVYREDPAQHLANGAMVTNLAKHLAAQPAGTSLYVANLQGYDRAVVDFFTRGRDITFLDTPTPVRGPAIIAIANANGELVEALVGRSWGAFVKPIDPMPGTGTGFTTIVVP